MGEDLYNGQAVKRSSGQAGYIDSELPENINSFREFCSLCEKIIDKFPSLENQRVYFYMHSLRLYNSFRFVKKITDSRKNLTLLAPGAGPAFVELCLSKFMGFKCTVVDLPNVVERNKAYYDWAGFESIGENIESYIQGSGKVFDVVMSLENIEHIPAAPSSYIAKFVNAITDGGYFVISTPNMGSIAHLARIAMMLPTLPVPELTFNMKSYVHYREYMPCEIIEAYGKNGLRYKARAYTNESPAFRKYSVSRPSMHHVKNTVMKSLLRWIIQPCMSLFGIIPRFRYTMILAAQK